MSRIVAIAVLVFASATVGQAQAARVARLSLLAPPAAGATCSITPASAALRRSGMARVLNVSEPSRPRLLSLGISAAGKPQMLMVMMSTRDGERSEGESVTAFFGKDGATIRGNRSAYTTGTPARRSDDQSLPLLSSDSAQAKAMARALLRLCRG